MIYPISPNTRNSVVQHHSYRPTPGVYTSTLSSSAAKPLNIVLNILSNIFAFVKNLFVCGLNPTLSQGENIPEISPKTLSKSDPFRRSVFSRELLENQLFQNQKAFEKTSELFKILGTTSYYSWVASGVAIYKRESEVVAFNTPPLTFLYYLLLNGTKTSYLNHFKHQSPFAWRQFLRRLGADFGKSEETLLPLLSGFCKALSLDYLEGKKLIEERNWEAFINWVFNNRKNHFNLN